MERLLVKEQDQIVITKSIGLSGTYALVKERYEQLHQRYSCDFLEPVYEYEKEFSLEPEYEVLEMQQWSACVEASYGGIFGALFRLGYDSGLGLRVDLQSIPIRQQVIEVSEFFQVNPYLLHSGGSMVIACSNGQRLCEALRQKGVPAVIAGSMTKEKARIVCVEEEERFLTPPRRDALLSCFEETYVKENFPKTIQCRNRDEES